MDGYELFCQLKDGSCSTIQHSGCTYTLQFNGVKTGALAWLQMTNEEGQSIRLGLGWGGEAF
jgi:hypothetical protein